MLTATGNTNSGWGNTTGGTLKLYAAHTYATAGTFTVTVTISEAPPGTGTATTTLTATVTAAATPGNSRRCNDDSGDNKNGCGYKPGDQRHDHT